MLDAEQGAARWIHSRLTVFKFGKTFLELFSPSKATKFQVLQGLQIPRFARDDNLLA
jgi:hypothetical protein